MCSRLGKVRAGRGFLLDRPGNPPQRPVGGELRATPVDERQASASTAEKYRNRNGNQHTSADFNRWITSVRAVFFKLRFGG